jgi:hypothetical protein
MPAGKIRRPSIKMMCNRVFRAWEMVSPEVIMKSFFKTGVSNAVDRNEDGMLWTED